MKPLNTIIVDESLLNEVQTLAAPAMLAMALRAAMAELGELAESWVPLSFSAEFRQGARLGDTVHVAIEELDSTASDTRGYRIHFSKDADHTGRVGKWRLFFTGRQSGQKLPYRIVQAAADGRTDRELWRPEQMIATGDIVQDAQSFLWLAGQTARSYNKRLDQELATGEPAFKVNDELNARRYAGIAVSATLSIWPEKNQVLGCAVDYQVPLTRQAQSKKMEFQEMLLATAGNDTYLLGTASFTVARLNAQGMAIYPNGLSE